LDTLAAAPPSSGAARPGQTARAWRLGIAVAVVAILVRLVPAVLAYGTSDVMTWELLGRLFLSGENFYATQLHNWPALWIYFCAAAVMAHDATGLPFFTLIKLAPIAADACIAVLLYLFALRQRREPDRAARLGLTYALNPVSILITGYHGQFDSLMLAPTVLSWYVLDSQISINRSRLIAAGLLLGLGIWFKPIPLLLLPVLLPRLSVWRDRCLFAVLAIAPATLGTLPYFARWPEDVAANFLGYSSWFGQWGYSVAWMLIEYVSSGTIPFWLPDPDYVSEPLRLMFLAGRWVLLAALAGAWWLIYRRRMDLLRGIVATFAVFYFATSGFGLQYLLWIVPFAVARRDRWLWPFTLSATGLLIVAYSLGLAYLPLETSPDNAPNTREFIVKLATLPTWIICGLWAWSLLRRGGASAEYNRTLLEQTS
jgi:uncharacterized membrane protein